MGKEVCPHCGSTYWSNGLQVTCGAAVCTRKEREKRDKAAKTNYSEDRKKRNPREKKNE